MSSPPALELRSLSASYAGPRVVHEVSLTVPAGHVAAVLGPNGAGKSTLLRAVMGLVPKVSGEALVHGESVVRRRTHHIARGRRVSYIPEGRGVLNSLTVRENLQLAARLAASGAEPGAVIERVTGRFPILRDRLSQPAGQLSGGQQQMLALARALAAEPLLMIVDEPSLGLAPLVRAEVGEILQGLAAEDGLAVLLAEQDVSMAAAASTVHLLRDGRLVSTLSAAMLDDIDLLRDAYLGDGGQAEPTKEGR